MCSSSVDLIVKNTMVQLDLDLGIQIGKYDLFFIMVSSWPTCPAHPFLL